MVSANALLVNCLTGSLALEALLFTAVEEAIKSLTLLFFYIMLSFGIFGWILGSGGEFRIYYSYCFSIYVAAD